MENESNTFEFSEDWNTEFYFVMALKVFLKQRKTECLRVSLVVELGQLTDFLVI